MLKESFQLRPYQIATLNIIDRDLKIMPEVLIQGITGCGKTVIFSKLVNRYYKETDRVFLILVHKQEIVQQIYNTLQTQTEVHFKDLGICCAGIGNKTIDRRVTVASIQSFVNVKKDYSYADLVICDEAHKIDISTDSQYKQVFDYLRLQRPDCRILGFTSTPSRLGHGYIYGNKCKPGSINIFPQLNHSISYETLKEQGHLVELKGVIASHESIEKDLAGVSTNGDYVITQIGEIMTKERHLQTAVEAIEKYCQGYNKICIFCCTIEHAEQLQELIGEDATIVHSQLSKIERLKNMNDWESGQKRIICSIGILTEGVDIPALDCLVFVRPTLSSTLWLQAIGRVLRTCEGKDHGFLVDLTDNANRFGFDIDNVKVTVPKTVEAIEKKEQELIKICPECEAECHMSLRECLDCGFQWPEQECVIAEALPNMKEVVFKKSPPKWYDIEEWCKTTHTSRKTKKELGRLIFKYWRTEYKEEEVSMWFCLPDNYTGFAVDQAIKKWGEISNDPFPQTVKEFDEAEIRTPYKICIDENDNYPQIIDTEFIPF